MPAQCCKDKWPTIPDDEPVFILRAKDKLARKVVAYWLELAAEAGVSVDKQVRVSEHLTAMDMFALDHPERMKIPD